MRKAPSYYSKLFDSQAEASAWLYEKEQQLEGPHDIQCDYNETYKKWHARIRDGYNSEGDKI